MCIQYPLQTLANFSGLLCLFWWLCSINFGWLKALQHLHIPEDRAAVLQQVTLVDQHQQRVSGLPIFNLRCLAVSVPTGVCFYMHTFSPLFVCQHKRCEDVSVYLSVGSVSGCLYSGQADRVHLLCVVEQNGGKDTQVILTEPPAIVLLYCDGHIVTWAVQKLGTSVPPNYLESNYLEREVRQHHAKLAAVAMVRCTRMPP